MSRYITCPAAFPLVEDENVCRIAEDIDEEGAWRPVFPREECEPYDICPLWRKKKYDHWREKAARGEI